MAIQEPKSEFSHQFFTDGLYTAPAYYLEQHDVQVKLDQNEAPFDWPPALKKKVLDKLEKLEWQRYPQPFAEHLNSKLAKHIGVHPENILTGVGSNFLITLVLSAFCKKLTEKNQIWVARPSFPLYESHLTCEGISYTPWVLTEDLEYDVKALKRLPKPSLVIFASPNNPVGNSLSYETLNSLLEEHQETLFIADEAYFEFQSQSYLDLLQKHSHLIIIRTFSKVMGSAGVRFGYIVSARHYIQLLAKLRLPYLLNHWCIAAIETLLDYPQLNELVNERVKNIQEQREHIYDYLQRYHDHITIKPSEANFLLFRLKTNDELEKFKKHLLDNSILVRDVSKAPLLQGCLRVTIGHPPENRHLLKTIDQYFSR